jgi:hypothetical protein
VDNPSPVQLPIEKLSAEHKDRAGAIDDGSVKDPPSLNDDDTATQARERSDESDNSWSSVPVSLARQLPRSGHDTVNQKYEDLRSYVNSSRESESDEEHVTRNSPTARSPARKRTPDPQPRHTSYTSTLPRGNARRAKQHRDSRNGSRTSTVTTTGRSLNPDALSVRKKSRIVHNENNRTFQDSAHRVTDIQLRPVPAEISFFAATIQNDGSMFCSRPAALIEGILGCTGEVEDISLKPLAPLGSAWWHMLQKREQDAARS